MAPFGQRRIVEKRKTDRLLHLIDKIVGQKDMGNMSLFIGDLRWSLRVETRLQHCGDEFVLGSPAELFLTASVHLSHNCPHPFRYRKRNAIPKTFNKRASRTPSQRK